MARTSLWLPCVWVALAPVPAWADALGVPIATSQLPVAPPSDNPPERPFLFATDPSLPAPGEVLVSAGLGNVTRTAQTRPVGAGPLLPTLGAEVGVLPRLSLYAEGGAAVPSPGQTVASPATVEAGAHLLLTRPSSRMWRVALQASYGLDFEAASSLKLNATVAWNYERARVIGSLTASRTFKEGSDGVDLGGMVGASVALAAGFRAGVELVATDLEEVSQPLAEGGAMTYAGPTVGWEWGERLQLVAGPAVRLDSLTATPSFLGRAAATLRF